MGKQLVESRREVNDADIARYNAKHGRALRDPSPRQCAAGSPSAAVLTWWRADVWEDAFVTDQGGLCGTSVDPVAVRRCPRRTR